MASVGAVIVEKAAQHLAFARDQGGPIRSVVTIKSLAVGAAANLSILASASPVDSAR
jgi:hypothetical protein